MGARTVELGPADGSLVLTTGVAGRAARMGHALELAIDAWEAAVDLADGVPVDVRFRCVMSSMRVASATGGVLPVTDVDRRTILRNALRTLAADQHPYAEYSASIAAAGDGYALSGTLTIAGVEQPFACAATVTQTDGHWDVAVDAVVSQSAFGVTPYSLMLGALRVADEVGVRFRATVTA